MAQGSFEAKVTAWVRASKERMVAVRNDAAQEIISIAQKPGPSVANPANSGGGAMPISTGYLRSSLVATIGTDLPALQDNPNPDGKFSFDQSTVNLTIAGADINAPITAAYSARYARVMENRYAFVRLAVQQWPRVVAQSAAAAEAYVKSRG